MIGRLAALMLLSTATLILTAEVPRLIAFTETELGSDVTFRCPFSKQEGTFFNWYKQPLGEMVQTVATAVYEVINLIEPFNSPRFRVRKGKDEYFLTIGNVNKEDEATYFCESEAEFLHSFKTGFFLAVNDCNQQTSVYVEQTPETTSVQLGDPVTLQCSLHSKSKENIAQCPDDHSVHWFRAGSGGFHPGIIYTHWNRTDDVGRSCVYRLSKTIKNSSDAGTYYCAVVSCGEILFGGGTTVETRRGLDPVVLVLGVLLGCCVAVIAVLVFYACQRRACERCTAGAGSASHHGGHDESTVERSNESAGDAVNYAALDFCTRKSEREKKKSELPQECLYSAVRCTVAEGHTQHQLS